MMAGAMCPTRMPGSRSGKRAAFRRLPSHFIDARPSSVLMQRESRNRHACLPGFHAVRHQACRNEADSPGCFEGNRGHRHMAVSYTHLRAHETVLDLVCRLLLEKKKKKK